MLIEAASSTFLMKNLVHSLPSNSYIMNSGFLIELIEVASKFMTIIVMLSGMYFNKEQLHNILVIVYVLFGSLLLIFLSLAYGRMRIRVKLISDNYYQLIP